MPPMAPVTELMTKRGRPDPLAGPSRGEHVRIAFTVLSGLLTVEEAARAQGVDPRTIRRRIDRLAVDQQADTDCLRNILRQSDKS